MRFKKLIIGICILIVTLMLLSIFGFTDEFSGMGCTAILVGKDASENKLSVMNSTSADGWYNSNIQVISKTAPFQKGDVIPIYWNITGEDRPEKYLEDFSEGQYTEIGKITIDQKHLDKIPYKTGCYTYFRTGYSCMNDHQLTIGESTIVQKVKLRVYPPTSWTSSYTGPIMTIEQLQIFALQCTDNARDAIKLIGYLAERHGFLPSCYGQGECLTIADTKEVWVFEIFSVGAGWNPTKFKPKKPATFGAVWAAQRVPDDEIVCVPNISRIREIDLSQTDYFMASDNYEQCAINHGIDVYDGSNFIWQESYTPLTNAQAGFSWSLEALRIRSRLYVVYSTFAEKNTNGQPWDANDDAQKYPFSIKPDTTPNYFPKGVSVKDIIELQRSTMTGTNFDIEANPSWLVPGPAGTVVKSPLATPFPGRDLRELLDINRSRTIAMHKCSYAFVSQSRESIMYGGKEINVPDYIGGVLWFCLDNPHMSVHVPIYAGVTEIPKSWQTFDRDKFSQDSARWAFALADDLVNRRYQDAIQDLKDVRDTLQDDLFLFQLYEEWKALWLKNNYSVITDRDKMAKSSLTAYTKTCMEKAEKAYWNLNWHLIQKYNNNKFKD